MELWLVFCLFLLVVVAAYLLWPKKRSINIKKFPRKYSDVKVSSSLTEPDSHTKSGSGSVRLGLHCMFFVTPFGVLA